MDVELLSTQITRFHGLYWLDNRQDRPNVPLAVWGNSSNTTQSTQ